MTAGEDRKWIQQREILIQPEISLIVRTSKGAHKILRLKWICYFELALFDLESKWIT